MVVSSQAILLTQIGLIALSGLSLLFLCIKKPIAWPARWWRSRQATAPLVMLFENGTLVDANCEAKTYLGLQGIKTVTWGHIRGLLENRISSLPLTLGQEDTPIRLHPNNARPGEIQASLEQWSNLAKLSLYNWPTVTPTKAGIRVPVSEFESLTNVAMDSPFPIWRMSMSDQLIWANPAFYREYGNRVRIGDELRGLKFKIPKDLKNSDSFRVAFHSSVHNAMRYFDITMLAHAGSRTFFAVSADKAVQADEARRGFIQTLSKTFAQLSTGLAIFDTDRRLVLFNPALMDQFGLSAAFLSGEPTLTAFFDKLRESRMIPEPKSYSSWRERIMHLVLAASDDRYREIWPLPSGETYRVTGRPHPDGAVAFLFEDISAELLLERRFRAQLDMTRAVINNLNHAIAVVSPGGNFSMTNTAFHSMWGVDPDSSLSNFAWSDFENIWHFQVKESLVLGMISNYIRLYHERQSWTRSVLLENGNRLKISADPVSGGFTILTFSQSEAPVQSPKEKLRSK